MKKNKKGRKQKNGKKCPKTAKKQLVVYRCGVARATIEVEVLGRSVVDHDQVWREIEKMSFMRRSPHEYAFAFKGEKVSRRPVQIDLPPPRPRW